MDDERKNFLLLMVFVFLAIMGIGLIFAAI